MTIIESVFCAGGRGMMERLTEPAIGCFKFDFKELSGKHVPGEFGTYEAFWAYSMLCKNLGEYEDTDLTPKEIINYRDIASEKYSWDSLMQQLDDCYPAKIYTGVSGDIGPLIIVKLREIDALRKQVEE